MMDTHILPSGKDRGWWLWWMATCMGNWLNVDSLAPGEEVAVNSFLPWFGGSGLSVSGE